MAAVDIVARLKLSGEQFTREFGSRMDRAEAEAKKSSSRINAAFSKIGSFGGGLVAGVGIAAIAAAGQRSLEYASSLGEVSQQLGVTTRDLQIYRYAATQVGIEQDAMDRSLAKLTKTIGMASTGAEQEGRVFRSLGIDIRDVNGNVRTAGQIIPELADVLGKVKDPAQRAAVEVSLFGRAGQQLDTLLAGGKAQIDNLSDAAEKLGIVLSDEQIQTADETADKLAAVKQVLEANIAKTVADNSGAILGFANSLSAMGVALANWWAQKPEQAMGLMGAIAGSRLGPIGAAVGGAAGYGAGLNMHKGMAQSNSDLKFRVDALRKARQAYADAAPDMTSGNIFRLRPGGQKTRSEALRDLQVEIRLTKEATTAHNQRSAAQITAASGGLDVLDFNAPKGSGGGSGRTRVAGKSEGDRAAEREAKDIEKREREVVRIREALEESTREMETQLRLGDLRARGLDEEADRQEAVAKLHESHREAVTSTDAATRDLLATNERLTLALVAQGHAGEAAKETARAREQAEKEALEAQERFLEEQADIQREQVQGLADFYEDAFRGGGRSIWETFEEEGRRAIAEIAAQWTLALLSGQKVGFSDILAQLGANHGGRGGGLIGTLSRLTQGVTMPEGDGSIGTGGIIPKGPFEYVPMPGQGGLGGAAGSAMQMLGPIAGVAAISSTIGSALGFDPVASIFGLVGGALEKIFGGTKKGTASLSFDAFGGLGVGATGGNSGKRIGAASGAIGEVASILDRIAEQLDGQLTGRPSVSLGMREGKWRLDPTGRGMTKIGNGAVDYGEDQEAAIRAAVADALQDGVIGGISDAARRILTSGQQLEQALEKALMIEEIPKLLAGRIDPVGAAIDALNDKWRETIAALEEGGASAEQMADAQKLYKMELDETKAATAEASANLKEFLKSLDFGTGSPFSLRDQGAKAEAALQPYLAKIAAGDAIDQAKYQEAAQSFLEIERELYGSTRKYFESLDMIQAQTGKAIATIDNAVPIRTYDDPFAQATASHTQATAEISAQMNGQLGEIKNLLGQILAAGGSGKGGFIGYASGLGGRVVNQ